MKELWPPAGRRERKTGPRAWIRHGWETLGGPTSLWASVSSSLQWRAEVCTPLLPMGCGRQWSQHRPGPEQPSVHVSGFQDPRKQHHEALKKADATYVKGQEKPRVCFSWAEPRVWRNHWLKPGFSRELSAQEGCSQLAALPGGVGPEPLHHVSRGSDTPKASAFSVHSAPPPQARRCDGHSSPGQSQLGSVQVARLRQAPCRAIPTTMRPLTEQLPSSPTQGNPGHASLPPQSLLPAPSPLA